MPKDPQINLGRFHFRPASIALDGRPPLAEWKGPLEFALWCQRASPWWIGDMINAGEDIFGEEFAAVWGDTLSTEMVSRYASVARRVPPRNRRPKLSWSAHAAVARLADHLQRRMLAMAEREGWNSADLQQKVRELVAEMAKKAERMTYSAGDIAIIGLVMTLGSVVQGAVGFASGLMGVPLLVLCGFSLLDATVINFVSSSVQNVTGSVQLWSHVDPVDLAWPALYRCMTLPLGVAALSAAGGMHPDRVQQIVGVILLASIVLLTGLRVRPRDRLHPAWVAVTFLTSGFLMGFATVGGTPMVMYVNSLTWSAARSRGFLFCCSTAIMPLMAVLLVWKFGHAAAHAAAPALIVMPPVIAGLWLGLRLGQRLDKALFRRVTYGLLIVIAVGAIVSPWAASFRTH